MDIKQILEEELEDLRLELIAAYDAKGMRASGKWADSLEVLTQDENGRLLGLDYTQQLEDGRSAGGFPPVDQIEQWIEDKGILAIDADITIKQLAFLIARKIAREGWNRENYGGVDLVSEVVTPQRVQKIIDKIVGVSIIDITSEVFDIFTETFK
jgi:hypothetical protein